MSIERIKLCTVIGLLGGFVLIFLGFGKTSTRSINAMEYEVAQIWKLPKILKEVSGIAWLGNEQIAAVQDEDGIIFIYNLRTEEIVEEINFAQPGDYEGIAVNSGDAYVLRSDGTILEIIDFRDDKREVNMYETSFTSDSNMESLEWDAGTNSLLLAPKDHDMNSDFSKGIYSFSLASKKLQDRPVHTIDMTDKVLKRYRNNDIYKTFRPSDLAIHPKTKDIFILEGVKPKLLVLDPNGKAKEVQFFDKKAFPQPEGITFSPDGALYIATEAKKNDNGMLFKLKISDLR